jgi:hypothetical protein
MDTFDGLTGDDLLDIREQLTKPREDRTKLPCYLTPFGYAIRVDGEWLDMQQDLVPVSEAGDVREEDYA